MPKLGLVGIATLLLALASPLPVASAFFWVDTVFDNDDWNPGDGYCSTGHPLLIPRPPCTLRAAIQETNATSTSDEIGLPAGTYVLTRAGQDEDQAATGDLDIYGQLAIYGAGASETIVDGNGLDRVFEVHSDGVVYMSDLTVTGGALPDDKGGGIWAGGSSRIELVRCHIAANRARAGGGVSTSSAFPAHQLFIEHSLISDNLASDYAGGVFARVTDFRLRGSTVAHNRCEGAGPSATLLCAGGLDVSGFASLEIVNSTISGNRGAGIFGHLDLSIVNTTIVSNERGVQFDSYGTLEMQNTIVAQNSDHDCFFGGFPFLHVAGGHNLSSDASCGLLESLDDLVNASPQLHPLGYHPPLGPNIAPSHHPRWGSVVVDSGRWQQYVTFDQDHSPRPEDGDRPDGEAYDIGAIEVLPCGMDEGAPDYPDQVVAGDLYAGATSIIVAACRSVMTAGVMSIWTDPGRFIAFRARDSVVLANGFSIGSGSNFRAEIRRDAGAPP